MFFLKKAYCRVFQIGFRAVLPVLPYREPEIIRSCADLSPVLEKEHARTVLVVTDRGIVENGLTAPLEEALRDARAYGFGAVHRRAAANRDNCGALALVVELKSFFNLVNGGVWLGFVVHGVVHARVAQRFFERCGKAVFHDAAVGHDKYGARVLLLKNGA